MTTQKVVLYHNPRCSKSREALALLQEKGVEPEVIEYLKTPLAADGVKALIGALGVPPHALLRTKEEPYARLGLSEASTLDEVARAIAEEPILMERPVLVVGSKARIGRPPQGLLALL
jgi:arsenate reductase